MIARLGRFPMKYRLFKQTGCPRHNILFIHLFYIDAGRIPIWQPDVGSVRSLLIFGNSNTSLYSTPKHYRFPSIIVQAQRERDDQPQEPGRPMDNGCRWTE